ncbi:MAG: hypothetical protein NVSMB6_11190 [Burkholderiaceae bacterium]
MKKTLMTLALPLVWLVAGDAFAAKSVSSDAATTRADVKADTRATTSGAMGKENEASAAMAADSKMAAGDKSRAEVKAETKTAAKAGDLPKQGEAVGAEKGVGTDRMAGETSAKPKKHRAKRHRKAASEAGAAGATESK